tara:strand:- start:1870 stop:2592 length:723 start_codon:yes stop_codon:yes gene_type:complete
MTANVILLSNTSDIEKYGLTCRAINTLQSTAHKGYSFNIVVVESNKAALDKGFLYPSSVAVVTPEEDFSYNKYLNHGLAYFEISDDLGNVPGEWTIVANNDVIFTDNWFNTMMEFHNAFPEYKSLCPFEPNWHPKRDLPGTEARSYVGYRTSYEIAGWCIAIHKDVIKQCDLFDERFDFWYQDNDYALTIEAAGIKHALVVDSRVYHDVSGSHDLLTDKNKHDMTDGQYKVLKSKWGDKI